MSQPNNNPTIGGGGFHHVAIKVADFDRAVDFYTTGLGFTSKITWGEGDKRAVMLDTGDGNYLEIFAGGDPNAASEARMIHYALRTTNCEAAHQKALAAGATERMAPKEIHINGQPTPADVKISFVIAPTGEIIEFFENQVL